MPKIRFIQDWGTHRTGEIAEMSDESAQNWLDTTWNDRPMIELVDDPITADRRLTQIEAKLDTILGLLERSE